MHQLLLVQTLSDVFRPFGEGRNANPADLSGGLQALSVRAPSLAVRTLAKFQMRV